MDKLMSLEDLSDIIQMRAEDNCKAIKVVLARQLADMMQENERLRSFLKAFYFDTMYKDSPALHDKACELLAPYDAEFLEVKQRKHFEAAHVCMETINNICVECGKKIKWNGHPTKTLGGKCE